MFQNFCLRQDITCEMNSRQTNVHISQTEVLKHRATKLVLNLKPRTDQQYSQVQQVVEQTQIRVLRRFEQILQTINLQQIYEDISRSERPQALEQMMLLDFLGDAVKDVLQEMRANNEICPYDEQEWHELKKQQSPPPLNPSGHTNQHSNTPQPWYGRILGRQQSKDYSQK